MRILKITNMNHQAYLTVYILLGVSFLACNSQGDTSPITSEGKNVEVSNILKLGLEEQGEDFQLGDPKGVRTDENNNIYIADRASLTIKVYNQEGEFVKEIGRRGRGPAEFLDINSFEITPEGNFFVLDRGNMRYTQVTKNGEPVSSEPIDFSMEWQFYPDDIDYYEDKALVLFNDGVHSEIKPLLEKELFYVYDKKLKTKYSSFFKFSEFQDIEVTDFAWVSFLGKPGSFILNQEKDELFYSPLIYHGNIYQFTKTEDEWKLSNVIKTGDTEVDSYVEFERPLLEKYRQLGVPGLRATRYGGGPDAHIGRVNTFDAGIHQLSDGRVILFVGKWRDPLDKKGEHENVIDIYAQIINQDYSVETVGLITSVEAAKMPWKPFVNWKDADDNFYLLDNTDINYPTVTKFRINQLED